MTTLLDRHGKLSAFFYNNKVLLASTSEVIGIILGDCVFGKSGEVKGKIFNKTLYAASGEIVAREQELQNIPAFDPLNALFEGWAIVDKITHHECPWITPKDKWHPLSIEALLKQEGQLTLLKRNTESKVLQ